MTGISAFFELGGRPVLDVGVVVPLSRPAASLALIGDRVARVESVFSMYRTISISGTRWSPSSVSRRLKST